MSTIPKDSTKGEKVGRESLQYSNIAKIGSEEGGKGPARAPGEGKARANGTAGCVF